MRYDSLSDNRIYIFAAHSEMQRSSDLAYAFQQDPYFFWLTGLNEPNWTAVINTYTGQKALLAPARDTTKTLFDGTLDDSQVKQITGIDTIIEKKNHKQFLEELSEKYDTVHMIGSHPHQKYFDHTVNPSTSKERLRMGRIFKSIIDCRSELDKLRAIKSDSEIAEMRRAIKASNDGFVAMKQKINDGAKYEYELEAVLNFAFRSTGAHGHAYDPIVACAGNACTLHYGQNSAKLPTDGLVLVDAGATYNGYCADITRTYAIGMPTERQVTVHSEVEAAHQQIIASIGRRQASSSRGQRGQ